LRYATLELIARIDRAWALCGSHRPGYRRSPYPTHDDRRCG